METQVRYQKSALEYISINIPILAFNKPRILFVLSTLLVSSNAKVPLCHSNLPTYNIPLTSAPTGWYEPHTQALREVSVVKTKATWYITTTPRLNSNV
jgi:hypothetical protein